MTLKRFAGAIHGFLGSSEDMAASGVLISRKLREALAMPASCAERRRRLASTTRPTSMRLAVPGSGIAASAAIREQFACAAAVGWIASQNRYEFGVAHTVGLFEARGVHVGESVEARVRDGLVDERVQVEPEDRDARDRSRGRSRARR